MRQFMQTFLHSFKIKPGLSTFIVFLLIFQMFLEGSNLFSLVPLMDMLVRPNELNIITQKINIGLQYFDIEPSLPVFIVLVSLTTIVKFLGLYFIHIMISKYQRGMDLHLTTELYTTLFSSKWPYFASNNVGTLVEIVAGKCHGAAHAFYCTFQFSYYLFNLIVFSVVPLMISFDITLGCILVGGVLLLPLLLTGKLYYKIAYKKELILNEYTQYLVESLSAAKLIFAYALSRSNILKFNAIARQHRRRLFQQDIVSGGITLLNEPISILFVLVIIYLFFYQTSTAISGLVVIVYSLKRMMASGHSCVTWYNNYKGVRPAIDMVSEESRKALSARETSGNLDYKGLKEGITFVDTAFHYAPGKEVLKGICLEIKRGEMTAFVGGSGEGKTTIVDLIVGLYRPTGGQVLLDGVDLREYDLKSWRERLGYIPQESVLFNATIKENILWGTERSVSDDELFDAAKKASAQDFILECKDGYNTVVGDRGVRLSGGQRQRIALARAILRKPEVLILDEATSSLDSESEAKIQHSIETLSREITVIVVAHRLSTIRNADKIYILNKGEVAGAGTFHELVESNTLFQRYSELQEIRA